jgi:hypothetical protein
MRKLMLLLIAFIAVVTFIRAFDMKGSEILEPSDAPLQTVPSDASSDLPLQASFSIPFLSGGVESGIGN